MNAHTRRSTALPFTTIVALALVLALSPAVLRADDLKDGRTALQAGDYDRALASFEKAASQGLAEGRAGVGLVHLRRRQNAQALEAFQLAQKMDGNLAMAYYGQGEVYRRAGKCDQAVPLLQKATDLDKKFPEAQLALGECLVALKKIDAAIAVYSVGTKWGPKWRPKFLVGLGYAEQARDSLRSASVYFTQAREESPDDPAPRRALGDFYMKSRGIAELAIPEYEAAVAMDSTDIDLRYALAQGLFYGQRYNDALEEFKWVVAKDPEFAPGQLGLGNLYFLSGPADPRRYNDARAPLEKYTQLEPNDGKGWSLLGRTYYFLKMKDEAVAALDKASDLGGLSLNKEGYTILGRIYAEKKEWAKALAAFEKGEPNSRDMLLIAQMWVLQGQPQRADSLYGAIIQKDSTSSDAKFALQQLGMMRFRSQDFAGSIPYFQRRIALDPSSDEAYYYLGLALKELKQYPEALAALLKAAELAPGKADRHFWVGILYAQQDSVPGARASLQRSLDIDSTGTFAGVAFRQLGFYDLIDRSYDDAIRKLERATVLNGNDVQAWVWLAQGYQNKGNRERAAESYRKALSLDPKQPDALRGIQTLGGSAAK
jgi:tetratricopeptide (TPR) repeat protein